MFLSRKELKIEGMRIIEKVIDLELSVVKSKELVCSIIIFKEKMFNCFFDSYWEGVKYFIVIMNCC